MNKNFLGQFDKFGKIELIELSDTNKSDGYKGVEFEEAKEMVIKLMENKIEMYQKNIKYIKTVTLDNWRKHSCTTEQENYFKNLSVQ